MRYYLKLLVIVMLITLGNLSFLLSNSNFINSPPNYSNFDTFNLPKTNAGEITILTPENVTYTEAMSGYYPAVDGFENELEGTSGTAIDYVDVTTISGGCEVQIYDEFQGHKKVLRLHDGSTAGGARAQHNFATTQTTGSIEWYWLSSSSGNNNMAFHFHEGLLGTHAGRFLMQDDSFKDMDDIIVQSCVVNQWYHHKIVFNTISDTYDWYIDGILRVDDGNFENPVTNIGSTNIKGGWTSTGSCYVDAIGYSWDPSYDIGDNLNEGLLLNYENTIPLDWVGYSLDGQANKTINGNRTVPIPINGVHNTQVFGNSSLGTMFESNIMYFTIDFPILSIITPENKTYTEPMNGYYPATYGFENCENGELPNDWYFVPHHGFGEAYVIETFDGHCKVLKIEDTSSSAYPEAFQEFNPQTIGTIELYLRKETGRAGYYLNFYSNSSEIAFNIKMDQNDNGKFEVGLGTDFTEFATGKYFDQTWFHFRIDFDTFQDEATIYLDGINVIEIEFSNFVDDISKIRLGANYANTGVYYADAIGYSWDPNYNIGDNLFEGLLLSYENRTNLDWIGYSLDGQSNKTILGQTTIPFLNNGIHSLVLTANDTSGTFFHSTLRYFTVFTTGPIISATSPLSNQYFGVNAPSFNVNVQGSNLDKFWYSLDNKITNISFYSSSGVISQSEWDKYSHGPVQINFYVNDSFNQMDYDVVTVNKDLNAPTTSIYFVPYSGVNVVLPATIFSLIATDNSESGVSTIRYRIDSSGWILYVGAFTLASFASGLYTITYQSIDDVGNIETENYLVIELYFPSPQPDPPNFIPFLLIGVGVGIGAVLGIIIFLFSRRRTPKTLIKARTDEKPSPGSDKLNVCPFCYAQIKINNKYCTLCGASLEKD